MAGKFFILIPFLYFLALLQASFFVHFSIWGTVPNLILILIILMSFFASNWAMSGALIGGFFLDVFSANFIGWHILVLLAVAVFIKVILRKYVRIPTG